MKQEVRCDDAIIHPVIMLEGTELLQLLQILHRLRVSLSFCALSTLPGDADGVADVLEPIGVAGAQRRHEHSKALGTVSPISRMSAAWSSSTSAPAVAAARSGSRYRKRE